MAETYEQPPQAQPQSHSEEDRPLLAEVSHEMRSPLSSIIGFAESIEQEALGPWDSGEEQYRDYARHIRHSGQHLLDLFDDLLDIGDAQTFGIDGQDHIIPAKLLSELSSMLAGAAKRKRLTLSVKRPMDRSAKAPTGNRRLLFQALLNLAQNAIKFTASGGTVTLGYRADGKDCIFSVSHTGIGMDLKQRNLPRSIRPAPSQKQQGHGLGLRFVERVAKGHEGSLRLESILGQGTTAELILPLRRSSPAA
ncbi:MAG: sensor histidine kinase [Alphaproteobacteria bacterium]